MSAKISSAILLLIGAVSTQSIGSSNCDTACLNSQNIDLKDISSFNQCCNWTGEPTSYDLKALCGQSADYYCGLVFNFTSEADASHECIVKSFSACVDGGMASEAMQKDMEMVEPVEEPTYRPAYIPGSGDSDAQSSQQTT